MAPPELLKRKADYERKKRWRAARNSTVVLNTVDSNGERTTTVVAQFGAGRFPNLLVKVPNDIVQGNNLAIFDDMDFDISKTQTMPYQYDGSELSDLPHEAARLYDINGNPVDFPIDLRDKEGDYSRYTRLVLTNNSPTTVYIPDTAWMALANRVFVHNHPNGAGFSFDDLVTAQESNSAGMVAKANRSAVWDSIQQIAKNRLAIISELESQRINDRKAGLKENVAILDAMIEMTKQVEYNPRRPHVTYQMTPKNGKWPSKVHTRREKFNEHVYGFYSRFTASPTLNNLSLEAQAFLLSHGLSQDLSQRLGYNYSITGLQ